MKLNENLAKLIFQEFDDSIKGTDIYNHDGSMWLIFTEERKWVIEFTKQKTLWYNYKHFNDILMLFGMELTEGAEYIKKWYEDKFIFNVVKNEEAWFSHTIVDNVIDNGVKETISNVHPYPKEVIDIIQNGVKETKTMEVDRIPLIKKVFQNGVKEVEFYDGDAEILVNDAIENGVKEVMDGTMQVFLISDIIKKGVKIVDYHILESMEQKDHSVTTLDFTEKIKDTIENGVKEISSVDCEYPRATINVINNGVKKTYSLSEDLQHEVDDTIMMGVKYMMSGSEFKNNQVEDVIKYSEKL